MTTGYQPTKPGDATGYPPRAPYLPPEYGTRRDCCDTTTATEHTTRCPTWHKPQPTVLQEAAKAVDERGEAYGPPDENHYRTAVLWNAYDLAKYGRSVHALDEEDVCYMNMLQKMARDMHAPSRDSLVDIAGFVRNVEILRG